MDSSTRPRRTRGKPMLAGVVIAVAALLVPTAASAATHTGTRWCSGQFGWLKTVSSGATENRPPGSDWIYVWSTGGSRDVVAMTNAQTAKTGGGDWYGYGSISVTGTSHCESYG